MSDGSTKYHDRSERTQGHLQDLDDGCGCTEVWEYLSEQRVTD
jgi:hypothetical protein